MHCGHKALIPALPQIGMKSLTSSDFLFLRGWVVQRTGRKVTRAQILQAAERRKEISYSLPSKLGMTTP